MSTPSSSTRNANNVTQSPGGPNVRFTPMSAKKGRFAKVKNSKDNSTPVGTNNGELVSVTLVKPTQSETSICGIVISPKGFHMDKFMEDIFYKRATSGEMVKAFMENTGCVHRVFNVLDKDGNVLKKENQGKFYPIRSCFIPVEDPDELDNKDRVMAFVKNLGDNIWPFVDKKKCSWAKEADLPKILDWDRDVRVVDNYSDIIADKNDIGMLMTMSCKIFEIEFKEWLRTDDDNNVYTMFKKGDIDPELVNKWRLPFERLTAKDKSVYRKWSDEKERELKQMAQPQSLAGALDDES